MPRGTRRLAAVALGCALGIGPALALAGCAGSDDAGPTVDGTSLEGRTALAIDGTAWLGPTRLELGTECAHDLVVTVGADHGGSDLREVTIWGRPKAGRCRPTVTVRVPARTTKIVDGTTSQVVALPAR